MAHKSIGFHTRSKADNRIKLSGGSFGGAIDMETVERLVKALFTIEMLPSGSATFVDREGRQVSLYLSIDPAMTETGKRLLAQEAEARRAATEARERLLEELLDGLSTEEAIKRLQEDAK
ncbi:hypothetical protein EVC08_052 [Rhizobium phage RHph_N65]|nr:hypothetical protein EVC08_052 [Rhizobium phage RHph_N65]